MVKMLKDLTELAVGSASKIGSSPLKTWPLLALVALWCIYLRHAFSGSGSFALYMDNEFFLGPVLSSMSAMFSHGEWPLRLDSLLGGIPLYNFSQLSPFYPLYLIFLPIYSHPFSVIHSIHWLVLIHILITEINMYIFLRVAGTSRIAALVGSVLVAFSANSFAYATWLNIVAPYSWFPLYLAGLIGILKSPKSIRYSALALLSIVLLTLASPAQPLIHAVLCTAIFLFAHFVDRLRNHDARAVLAPLWRMIVIGILALFLAAPAILPVVFGLKDMIRWIGNFPPIVGNEAIPFAAFQAYQLHIYELSGIFFKIKESVVGNGFIGLLPIALASVALVSRPRSWLVLAFAFIAAYSLISSAGSNLGLLYLNFHLPLINKIREPSRFLVLFQFSIGALAAIGIDELYKAATTANPAEVRRRQIMALVATCAVAVATLLRFRVHVLSDTSSLIAIALLGGLTAFTWATFRMRLPFQGSQIVVTWSVAVAVLLACNVQWIPPSVANSQYLTSGALALDETISKVAALDPDRQYRVIFEGKINKQEAAMLAAYQDVRVLNFYFNPAPYAQFQQMYDFGPGNDKYFRALGAKYLICDNCTPEMSRGYKLIDRNAGFDIYEADDVSPRTYIARHLDGYTTDWQDFSHKIEPTRLQDGVLFAKPDTNLGLSDINHDAAGVCLHREDIRKSNYSRFTVQCASSGVLVVNEFFDDQWQSLIDGVGARPIRVNSNQIGIPFTAGSHVIELNYSPLIFRISSLLMLLGFVLAFAFFYAAVKNRARAND